MHAATSRYSWTRIGPGIGAGAEGLVPLARDAILAPVGQHDTEAHNNASYEVRRKNMM
jgi:hypothetical protein